MITPREELVDLCLSQIEMAFLREELDRAAGSMERGIDSASFRLRGRRPASSAPPPAVLDARRAALTITRLAEENRGLRELNSVWRGFALAAGAILLLVCWHSLLQD